MVRSRAQRGVSNHEATSRASPFETRFFEALLRVRRELASAAQ
jgi:hypothetical protein